MRFCQRSSCVFKNCAFYLAFASRLSSIIFPVDNPGPGSIAGGHDPLDAFLELGDVEFDASMANWFRMSSAPAEFKLVDGPSGRQFLFCIPEGAGVDIDPVEPRGRRTVGLQVVGLPHSGVVEVQTIDIGLPPLQDAPPVDGYLAGASDNTSAGIDTLPSAEFVSSSAVSGNDTTVSSSAAEKERQEFLAAVELTK